MIRAYTGMAISLVALFCLRCASITGGTGEETTNGRVTGYLTNDNGKPASHAAVSLVPAGYNPVVDKPLPDSLRGTTDASGRYSLSAAGSGTYNIEVSGATGSTGVLITGIQVDMAGITSVQSCSLQKTGSLRFIMQSSLVMADGYLYLPGTSLHAPVNKDTIDIDSVPAGYIPSANFARTGDSAPPIVIKTGFSVAPGAATIIPPTSGWKYSRRLFLNTTRTGLYVAGNVYGFPVLLRLSMNNFDFSKANTKGEDLRFTKNNGTPLHFEIERWESTLGLAEVWVSVDTLRGNDSTQSIVMLHGNPDAAPESNGAAVFDTANGFAGVWHLTESQGSTVYDATANRFDGTLSSPGPVSVFGNISSAKQFNGKTDFITIPNTANSKLSFPENGTYSISAWIWADAVTPSRQAIVSKGNRQFSIALQDSFCAFSEFKNLIGWETARSTVAITSIIIDPKTWVMVTGIRSGDRQYLYIDDACCTRAANEFIASLQTRLQGLDVSIGRTEDADTTVAGYFGGLIDEVRIYNRALTEDWVRLCFKNQIWNGALVKY